MNSTMDTSTQRVTEPLRAEHRELLPHIEGLRIAADAVGIDDSAALRAKVHQAYLFLTAQLIPHATAEDKVLYVEVDRLIGENSGTRATDTMRRDHTEVGSLTQQLGGIAEQLHHGELSALQQQDLRRILYSLYGIVQLHFAKEEEVYLPLLDQVLSAEEAEQMFHEMEHAATAAGGSAHAH